MFASRSRRLVYFVISEKVQNLNIKSYNISQTIMEKPNDD